MMRPVKCNISSEKSKIVCSPKILTPLKYLHFATLKAIFIFLIINIQMIGGQCDSLFFEHLSFGLQKLSPNSLDSLAADHFSVVTKKWFCNNDFKMVPKVHIKYVYYLKTNLMLYLF